MFKQPSKRVKYKCQVQRPCKPVEGSFVQSILTKTPTIYPEIKKGPIYNYEDYAKLLKMNNEKMGIPYNERTYPDYTPREYETPQEEPRLEYSDRIQVVLKVLKNGLVRVKVNSAISTLNEKYYSVCKKPPMKTTIQAFKSHGFSDTYLEKIKQGYERNAEFGKKVASIIEKIFDKQPIKKIKKKKEVDESQINEDENENENENEEEDIVPGDEGELDIEPDEDEIVEDEEYISDME